MGRLAGKSLFLMVQSVENVMDGVRGRLAVENPCGLFAFVFK